LVVPLGSGKSKRTAIRAKAAAKKPGDVKMGINPPKSGGSTPIFQTVMGAAGKLAGGLAGGKGKDPMDALRATAPKGRMTHQGPGSGLASKAGSVVSTATMGGSRANKPGSVNASFDTATNKVSLARKRR